jgi:DtxR family transcriptional regulator, Mn-dependent transcriptional regulator
VLTGLRSQARFTRLADKDLINYALYDTITLTKEGNEAAKGVVYKHRILRDFFIEVLGIAKQEAEGSACWMEHKIADVVMARLVQFIEFVRGVMKWSFYH